MPRTHIRANRAWWQIDWREIWEYRDLLGLLVQRDLTAIYKQTILGPLWFILQPLLTTVVFTVIFGKVAGISTEGVPQFVFYMSGTVLSCHGRSSATPSAPAFFAFFTYTPVAVFQLSP